MMKLTTKTEHKSTEIDGITFTVRTLNVIQRARRDAGIADERIRYTNLLREYQALSEEEKSLDAGPELVYRITLLLNEYLIPAALRAGLISISGIEIDSKPATAEMLIESGPDDLLMEIFERCEETAGLSGDDSKNLPSPGTSAGQKAGDSENTTAESASDESST